MKRIKLQITKKAAAVCSGYPDNSKCLAATAARMQFKTEKVFALPGSIYIDNARFELSSSGAKKIQRSYYDSSGRAKYIRSGFKPFVVILTKVTH